MIIIILPLPWILLLSYPYTHPSTHHWAMLLHMMLIITNLCITPFSVFFLYGYYLDDSVYSAFFAVNDTTGEIVLVDNDIFAKSFTDCTLTMLVEDDGIPALNDT